MGPITKLAYNIEVVPTSHSLNNKVFENVDSNVPTTVGQIHNFTFENYFRITHREQFIRLYLLGGFFFCSCREIEMKYGLPLALEKIKELKALEGFSDMKKELGSQGSMEDPLTTAVCKLNFGGCV
ncbi:hypothetical protein U1Q18_017274 [Sarracenia purpurea var. burkii]